MVTTDSSEHWEVLRSSGRRAVIRQPDADAMDGCNKHTRRVNNGIHCLRREGAQQVRRDGPTVAMTGCSPAGDRVFGPRVDPRCRPLDFTIQFEDVVLACIPSALFLVLS